MNRGSFSIIKLFLKITKSAFLWVLLIFGIFLVTRQVGVIYGGEPEIPNVPAAIPFFSVK